MQRAVFGHEFDTCFVQIFKSIFLAMDCLLNKTFKDVWLLFLVFYRQFNPIIA